ncbi:MAG TPA: DUF1810 domain-containing protein [Novosphingobium sp.]|nr:DUF1810 domain-containing protein [Novosphingobium sp.]
MIGGFGRFVTAQASTWEGALAELRAGAKLGHWMWFVFPQLSGLGLSPTARHYAIANMAEARAYLAHPVLGRRLLEGTRALLDHAGRAPAAILGATDAMKLRSSLTLFEAAGGDRLFGEALDAFFSGERDPLTLALLRR